MDSRLFAQTAAYRVKSAQTGKAAAPAIAAAFAVQLVAQQKCGVKLRGRPRRLLESSRVGRSTNARLGVRYSVRR